MKISSKTGREWENLYKAYKRQYQEAQSVAIRHGGKMAQPLYNINQYAIQYITFHDQLGITQNITKSIVRNQKGPSQEKARLMATQFKALSKSDPEFSGFTYSDFYYNKVDGQLIKKAGDTLSDRNTELKLKGISNGYERAAIIGHEFFGSA